MTTTATQVLEDVIAVNLHFSIWTGRKMLESTDLALNGEAPPREVINLGSKHTTDPKALKVFHTLKRQAERLCLRVGIPFLGGYAIPTAKADDVAKQLAKITAKFEAEKLAYLAKHDAIQDEWIAKFPKWELILRKAITPTQDVKNRINAQFSMFQIKSAQSAIPSINSGLESQVESLSNTLDTDILKSSKKLLESLTGAIQPNQTNVRGLKGLREKVEGLAFLNGKFSKLVKEIKKIEDAMPITGKLSEDETNKLSGLLFRMSDENKLQNLMSSIAAQPTATVAPQPQVVSEPEEETSFEFEADFDFGTEPTAQEPSPSQDASFFF